jgi:hypothetical protein
MTYFQPDKSGLEVFERLPVAFRASYFEISSKIVPDKLEKSDISSIALGSAPFSLSPSPLMISAL